MKDYATSVDAITNPYYGRMRHCLLDGEHSMA
jgi:hypothetical protein